MVLAMLADGRLHLSAIARLAPHLRDEDGEALLARAVGRCKREIEMIVAPSSFRAFRAESNFARLPARRQPNAASSQTIAERAAGLESP